MYEYSKMFTGKSVFNFLLPGAPVTILRKRMNL